MQIDKGIAMLICIAVCLVGCGGGDGESAPTPAQANPPPVTGANAAPTISGQPAAAVTVGETYSFQMTAVDPDGDVLKFSAANLPAWMSLDSSAGRLTGIPAAADVGTYSGIIISVSDGSATTSLLPFAIAVSAVASGRATLSWTAPTQNTDGSSLTDLSGYKIRYGRSAGDLTQSVSITNPSISTYVIENLSTGGWFFAVTAVNGAGMESAFSNVASKTIA